MITMSVIIPVRNMAGTIGRQFDALSRQSYRGEWEVLVCDNGSTDGIQAVCREWSNRLPELRLIDASHRRGASAARNMGAVEARGTMLAFCDADDVVCDRWLEAVFAAAQNHDFISGPHDILSLNPFLQRGWQTDDRLPVAMGFKPFAIGANLAVSKEAFDAVGGFCEGLQVGEDIDLSWRLQLAGYPLHYDPSMVVAKRLARTPGAMWRQSAEWGRGEIVLYMRFRQYGVERPYGIIPIYSDLKRAFARRGRVRLTVNRRRLFEAIAMNYGRWHAWRSIAR